MAAGVALAVEAPFDPPPGPLAAALVALLAAHHLLGRSRLAALSGPAMTLAALTLGALLLALQSEWRGTPLLAFSQTVRLEGRVVAADTRGDGGMMVVAPDAGRFRGPRPRRVRISLRGPPPPVGARVGVTARLFPLRGPVYPGGYDAARRLYFDGIGATGFAYGAPEMIVPADGGLAARVDALRRAISARVAATLGAGATAGFADALLVGQRGGMAESDVEALRRSGLGHILAISGLHMALVAGTVFAAVRLALALLPGVALRFPIRKWAAVAGLLAATAYLALSGASVATLRAYVMLVVGLVAILADRPALTMRTVAVAAVAVIVVDPVSVVEPGFQMSFLAVVALVGFYEAWATRPWRRRALHPMAAFLWGLALTSLIAGLATLPAAVFHFHRLAPLGLLANLSAMPLLTFIAMPAGVVALAAMPFGLEALPLEAMGLGLAAILAVARQVAAWTGDAGLVGRIPAAAALLACGGILWLALSVAWWRLLGLALLAAGLALAPTTPRPDLYVSDDGATVAARGPDGRLALLGRATGFAPTLWLGADGDARPPDAIAGARCDRLGCTLPLAAGHLAIARSPRALAQDCALAEVVVSTDRVARCAAPLVIDRRVLVASGAVTARRTARGWILERARPGGSRRRWHAPPEVARD
nr:ComEC/Rec2 family competence protein [Acuticoccus mangrovi]